MEIEVAVKQKSSFYLQTSKQVSEVFVFCIVGGGVMSTLSYTGDLHLPSGAGEADGTSGGVRRGVSGFLYSHRGLRPETEDDRYLTSSSPLCHRRRGTRPPVSRVPYPRGPEGSGVAR